MRYPSKTLALLLLTGLLAGCGKSAVTDPNGTSSNPEQNEVSSEIATNPGFVEDDVYDSEDVTEVEAAVEAQLGLDAGTVADGAPIHPLNFWRRITDVRRRFEFAFGDTDSTGRPTWAVVTVHKELTGTFNILAGTRDTVEARPEVIQKRLRDHWTRRVLLRRVRVPESDRPQWRIVATSGVEVVSEGATTDLVSLRVQVDGRIDVTITNPLEFYHLRRLLQFEPVDTVKVTVTTLRNDDVVVLQKNDRRVRLRNNGDNTYSGTFGAALLLGVHHVGVNALSHGTLFDAQGRYDSEAWILPYVSRPIELAYDAE